MLIREREREREEFEKLKNITKGTVISRYQDHIIHTDM